jgi:hypothetical protein
MLPAAIAERVVVREDASDANRVAVIIRPEGAVPMAGRTVRQESKQVMAEPRVKRRDRMMRTDIC